MYEVEFPIRAESQIRSLAYLAACNRSRLHTASNELASCYLLVASATCRLPRTKRTNPTNVSRLASHRSTFITYKPFFNNGYL